MTDRAAPKAKKDKADKADKPKKTGPKLVVADLKGIGHNSNNGEVIPGLVKIVDELLHLNAQKAQIGKAERDLRNRAKSEFGILSGPLAHEMRLRKMDTDVREQFESAHRDLKIALGYQTEMEFLRKSEEEQIKGPQIVKDAPTHEEVRAEEAKFTVEADPEDDMKKPPEEVSSGALTGGIISREG